LRLSSYIMRILHKGITMKKTLLSLSIILLTTGLIFASPSWIGIHGTGSYKQENTSFSVGASTIDEDHTARLAGLAIAGTIYLQGAPVGIGFLLGSSKTTEATRGSSSVDVSDFPLTWNAGVSGKFRSSMSEMLALEIGAGIQYELITQTSSIGGSDVDTALSTFSLLTSADVVVHLGDSLALVGGIGASFPFSTRAKFVSGSVSYENEDIDRKGYAINGKVGLALGF